MCQEDTLTHDNRLYQNAASIEAKQSYVILGIELLSRVSNLSIA